MKMWTLIFLLFAAGVFTVKVLANCVRGESCRGDFPPTYAEGCPVEYSSSIYRDCDDYWFLNHRTSGVYRVIPKDMTRGYDVYCEMTVDSAWLVFQRRMDGSVDFYKKWADYEVGFGNIEQEFWLGLLPLKRILSNVPGHYELRIDLEDWDGETRYAQYGLFDIGGPEDNYKLDVYGYTGNAGDDMARHSGKMFTTKDKDNDNSVVDNCAEFAIGAWWYDMCKDSNLNGFYHSENPTTNKTGISWKRWKGHYHSLKSTTMKIRRA